ncbi:MAG: HlyC/CorC family transporter [Anaerolineae bacterium]|nr:HlyC/CorC family transporter [Anaerolineae bacterium]
MEILIILFLTVINGVLAMAEIAVVSARKVRLEQAAEDGDKRATRALELSADQNRFLSTVQIGITLISILQGAFAGATLAHPIAQLLSQIPLLAPVSEALGLFIVVFVTTYLSLVIGELVPKRLGLQNPERIALLVAGPMHRLATITGPFVKLLSVSTDAVLRLLGARQSDEPPITQAEIEALIQQGIQAGVFQEDQQEMVAGVFSLEGVRLGALMTPRTEIEWLDLDDPPPVNIQKIIKSHHSRFPAAHGDLDRVVGIVRAKDLLNTLLSGGSIDLNTCAREPLFIPENATAADALELFKKSGRHLALVLSEHGGVEGLITLNNLVEQIIGGIDMPEAVQRPDGSWLLDGLSPIDDVKDLFDIKELPGEEEGHFQTLGGFVMAQLGHIPSVADHFECSGLRFEVLDMDGKRVDKVLVVPATSRDGAAAAP